MLPAQAPRRAFPFLCVVVLAMAAAGTASSAPPPLPQHISHAIGNSTDVLWMVWDSKRNEHNVFLRWNPTTGKQREYVVPNTAEEEKRGLPRLPRFHSVADTGGGLIFDSFVGQKYISEPARVTLITDDGKTLTTILSLPRQGPHMLVLADRSVLFIGGGLEWDDRGRTRKRSNAVERVVYASGRLVTERLPDLPGPGRTAFGMVALPDGRAMILGGSDSAYTGCSPCIADTYLLDIGAKKWTAGPPMLEARANPTVTLLPDGSILVAGGWTPGHGDGGWGVTSATTERWSPKSGRFVPGTPMPTGMAMHRAVWATGQEGKTLALAGGNSAAVLAYHVARDSWQVVAELCEPHQTENVFPFTFEGQSYLWLMDGKAGWCKEGRYDDGRYFPRSLVSLRLGASRFDPQAGIALNRSGFAFVPGTNAGPSYVVGGRVDGNNQQDIPDAYAIWPEGRIEHVAPSDVHNPRQVDLTALPPLTRSRRASNGTDNGNMAVQKLSDGRVVVAGGEVQAHKIALVTDESMTPGSSDTYIGIGEYLPSRRHEIYEPGTGEWRNSAPSIGAGGPVAIFDDGRVVKLGRQVTRTAKDGNSEAEQYLLEISSPDGRAWTRLDDPPVIKLSNDTRPSVIQNELFLSGRLPEQGGGSDIDAVLWLDTEHNRWETLWQIKPGDNWRFHIGRIIVRTLPNDKRIVMPVRGL